MVAIVIVADLPASVQASELVQLMVDGANAKAVRVAPCLGWEGAEDSDEPTPSDAKIAEAKLVLVGAIKRWADAGSGALSQRTAGPFGEVLDTRQRTGFNLWPSEIESLQDICKSDADNLSGAFSITPSGSGSPHMPWCSLMLGAAYCSCGADLTNYEYPLYEGGVLSDEY